MRLAMKVILRTWPSNAAAEGTSSSAATAPSARTSTRDATRITKKPRYLSETARTYDDAKKALTLLLAQVDHQRSPTTSGTVGYLLSHWLEVADLELGTRDGYEGYIRRNIVPTLGDVPLRNGRRVVLQPSTPPLRPGLSQPCRVREQMAPAAASYHRCRIAIPRLQNRINPRGGRRSDRGSRLAVVPRRWVVERTLA
jgi:hypothetical protein